MATAWVLLGACVVAEQSSPSWAPGLEFDAEPTSATFGELRLATLPAGGGWSDAARSRLEARVNELQAELQGAVVTWTGAVSRPGKGCRHPAEQPPILGRVEVRSRGLVFAPRFPWVAGLDHTVCLDGQRLAAILRLPKPNEAVVQSLVFSLPEPKAAAPRVTAVWPEVDEVPANLLRLYVHFDQPMHRRGVAEYVRWLDASGSPIIEPFVDVPNGLWDSDGRRLTLFLHPGRLKRGVGPREALGPVLSVGESAVLEIDGRIEALSGSPMGETARFAYRVGEPDRSSPEPESWVMTTPPTVDASLSVDFAEPLDRAQLVTAIRVLRDGEAVAGRVQVAAGGRVWQFLPAEPWRDGTYELEVDRGLEDLAGNSIERLFDVGTEQARRSTRSRVVAPSTPRGEVLRIEFSVAAE